VGRALLLAVGARLEAGANGRRGFIGVSSYEMG